MKCAKDDTDFVLKSAGVYECPKCKRTIIETVKPDPYESRIKALETKVG
jgi:hypothetical protein